MGKDRAGIARLRIVSLSPLVIVSQVASTKKKAKKGEDNERDVVAIGDPIGATFLLPPSIYRTVTLIDSSGIGSVFKTSTALEIFLPGFF